MKLKMIYVGLFIALGACAVQAANFCGEIKTKTQYGPFDYRKRAQLSAELALVENAHYTSDVENNIKGNTGGIGHDIDYTLRAWPNHARALATMSRQGILTKTVQVEGAFWPVDCYFLRAFQWTPDDGTPHAVYANHLLAHGKEAEALAEFKRAVELEPDNATFNYNAGLAYFKAKDYDKALFHAKKAYALKFPLPGLKNKLVGVGKWDDKPAE